MNETDSKETDKIMVTLNNMGTVNKNNVYIERSGKGVTLYFSYQTLVAVDGIVAMNSWSNTTAKLLNELEPNHEARVSHEEVLKEAQKRLKAVLGVE